MSNITVTELQGHTSGSDANTVKVKSGHTLAAQSNATVGGTLGVTGTTTTAQINASGSINTTSNTISVTNSSYPQLQLNSGVKNYHIFNDTGSNSLYFKNNTDAVNGMIMDSSGRVTKPVQPAFACTSHSGTTTLNTNSSDIDIPFDSVVYNIGSHYNTSNSRFTAPVAGRYFFYAEAMLQSNINNWDYMIISFKKNGGPTNIENMMPRPGGGNYASAAVTTVLDLAVSDYVTVWMRQSGGSGNAVVRNGFRQFVGYFLG